MPVWVRIGTLRGPDLALRLTTNADGTFALPLPASLFKAAPVATATVEALGARDHVVTLTSVTAEAVTGRVRRSRALPAVLGTLAVLAGFDPFEAPGIVIIHLVVRSANA